MTEHECSWEELRDKATFFDPGCSLKALEILQGTIASAQNEHQATILKHADAPLGELGGLDIRVFSCFLMVGLVPPMSHFFQAVMAAFSLHLAQLHPNTLLGLAIFQHFCETFMGVLPSVALFRRYFYPRVELGNRVAKAVSFCRRVNQADQFIPTTKKKKWDEWRHQWVFMHFPTMDDCPHKPDGPCERHAQWGKKSVREADLDPICARISRLVDSGMKGEHVVMQFIDHCIAPSKSGHIPCGSTKESTIASAFLQGRGRP